MRTLRNSHQNYKICKRFHFCVNRINTYMVKTAGYDSLEIKHEKLEKRPQGKFLPKQEVKRKAMILHHHLFTRRRIKNLNQEEHEHASHI